MEKRYEALCAAFRDVILHFGRMAFQQPGYVTAVLHDTAPQTDEFAEALKQLDKAGAFQRFVGTAADDAAQQQDAIRTVQQALAAQRAASPDLNGCLMALGEALQWHGDAWKALLAQSLAAVPEAAQTPAAPAEEKAEEPKFKHGDQIRFGRYPMGENGEVEPIIWQVLDPYFDENKILLISRDILDAHAFWEDKQTPPNDICWADSALAAWLNSDFIRVAFTEEEQKELCAWEAFISQTCGLSSGPEKAMKINIGDYYDVQEVMENYPEMADVTLQARVTPYAYAQGAYRDPKTGNGIWRLASYGGSRAERTDDDIWCEDHPEFVHKLTQTVDPDGKLDLYGDSTYADYVGVRPVIVVREDHFEAIQGEKE